MHFCRYRVDKVLPEDIIAKSEKGHNSINILRNSLKR